MNYCAFASFRPVLEAFCFLAVSPSICAFMVKFVTISVFVMCGSISLKLITHYYSLPYPQDTHDILKVIASAVKVVDKFF